MQISSIPDPDRNAVSILTLLLLIVSHFLVGCTPPPYAIPARGVSDSISVSFDSYSDPDDYSSDQIVPVQPDGFVMLSRASDSVRIIRVTEDLKVTWMAQIPSNDDETFHLFLVGGRVMVLNEQESDSGTLQIMARTFDPQTGDRIDQKLVMQPGRDVEHIRLFQTVQNQGRVLLLGFSEWRESQDSVGRDIRDYTIDATVIDGDLREVQKRRISHREDQVVALHRAINNDGSFDFLELHDFDTGYRITAIHYPADGGAPVQIDKEIPPFLHGSDLIYANTLMTTELDDGSRMGAVGHSVVGIDLIRWDWAAGRAQTISHIVYPDSLVPQQNGSRFWKGYLLDHVRVMPDSSVLLITQFYDRMSEGGYAYHSFDGQEIGEKQRRNYHLYGPNYILKFNKDGRLLWRSVIPLSNAHELGWPRDFEGSYAYHYDDSALDIVLLDIARDGVFLYRTDLVSGSQSSRQLVEIGSRTYYARAHTTWMPTGMIFMSFYIVNWDPHWKIIGVRP